MWEPEQVGRFFVKHGVPFPCTADIRHCVWPRGFHASSFVTSMAAFGLANGKSGLGMVVSRVSDKLGRVFSAQATLEGMPVWRLAADFIEHNFYKCCFCS